MLGLAAYVALLGQSLRHKQDGKCAPQRFKFLLFPIAIQSLHEDSKKLQQGGFLGQFVLLHGLHMGILRYNFEELLRSEYVNTASNSLPQT